MSIVALQDIQNELPTLRLSATSAPSIAQVQVYISEIESEVRAQFEAEAATWPADGSPASAYLKRTILEGVRWMTLRAKYTLSAPNSQSPDIDRAYKAYMDRLAGLRAIARSVQNVQDQQAGQPPYSLVPAFAAGNLAPRLVGSFGEYTQARHIDDEIRTAQRWTGNRPWPLF